MNKVDSLVRQIRQLENELLGELQKKQQEYFYIIEGKRIRFEEETRKYHRSLAKTLRRFFADASLANMLTAPIVYFCVIPALFLDLAVSAYQLVCFPVYRIPKVRRGDYIVIDRHSLQYLNWIEKMNCFYCSYFNGLIAYVQEIAARTEQYWCPIKHARRLAAIHSRYDRFVEYGDGPGYRDGLGSIRRRFDDLS